MASENGPVSVKDLFIYLFIYLKREPKRTFKCQMLWKKCEINANMSEYKFYMIFERGKW